MATKTAKTDGRGGARPNSGPKRETLSVRQVKEMNAKAKAYAKKYGKTIDEILLDFIYGVTEVRLKVEGEDGDSTEDIMAKKVGTRDRIACIKLWKDHTGIKLMEGGEADKNAGPSVYLPEQYGKVLKMVGRDEVEPEKESSDKK